VVHLGRWRAEPGALKAPAKSDAQLARKMPMRILLDDDHHMNRKFGNAILRRLG
jgi:hypothetical protein